MCLSEMESPVGDLIIAAKGGKICAVLFKGGNNFGSFPWVADDGGSDYVIEKCKYELNEYFAGRLKEFTVPIALEGTPFRMRVWEALRTIPYGQTISYKQLAEKIGKPSAARAVGGANHNNPISIIVPCHRVIGADGKLTGYGGGMENKEFLLGLELRIYMK